MKAMKAKKFPEAMPAPGCISVHPSRNLLRHAGHILRLIAQILRSGQPEFDVQLPVSANHNLFNDATFVLDMCKLCLKKKNTMKYDCYT